MTGPGRPRRVGTPRATRVEMVQIVLPGLTNTHGTVFGGELMKWVDICAGVAAGRHARGPVVTASMDRLHFLRPVRLGDVVVLQAQVNDVGRTSMEVGVRVFAESLRSSRRVQATRAYLTFVAVDAGGRPVEVPPLRVVTADDRRRQRQAKARRASRLAERRAMGRVDP